MTNKLVIIINSLKVPKIKKLLLYEIKFLVPNYSCLQNTWLGCYRLQIPRSLCPLSSAEFAEPPLQQNSCVRHCREPTCRCLTIFFKLRFFIGALKVNSWNSSSVLIVLPWRSFCSTFPISISHFELLSTGRRSHSWALSSLKEVNFKPNLYI
jgi:hypothetical protein